jgi:hypothetical protein
MLRFLETLPLEIWPHHPYDEGSKYLWNVAEPLSV